MTESPLFIIGTERSGSNLLRLILNTHRRIAIPHPPHVVRYFAPLEAAYGDLSRSEEAFAAFVDDILAFVRMHIYPWDIPLDRARVFREAEPRDAFGVTISLYDQYREHLGKSRWGCKSTFMIDYTDRVLARFPNARLIYLTRDPRDVAVSSRQSVFNPFHPYFTARLWSQQQRTGLRLLRQLPSQTILRVSYEDLISNPASTVTRVCDFLGETFEEQILRYFNTAEARKAASLSRSWKNAGGEILGGNSGKYRKELSQAVIRALEGAAGDEMEKLGYVRDFPPSSIPPSLLTVSYYRLLDLCWHFRVECGSLLSDGNHWRRWRRDLAAAYFRVRRWSRNPVRGDSYAATT